jgi:hypothetical protein
MKFPIALLFLSQVAFAAPKIIPSPVKHLYIPEGFDSNDSVEVVVTGEFPNTCYARNRVEVKFKDELIDVTITAIAPDDSKKDLGFCTDVIVPFKEVIAVGNLQGGRYSVRVNGESQGSLRDDLLVVESTSSAVDDSVYAAVERVEDKGNGNYILHGWNYSPCLEIDTITVVSNKKDTLSILPVMKQTSDFCPMKGVPVSHPVKLDFSTLKMKQPLLHVRTMDGRSINTIVDFERR